MGKGKKHGAAQVAKSSKHNNIKQLAEARKSKIPESAKKSNEKHKDENPTGSNKKSKPNTKSEVDTDDSDYTASPEKPAKKGKICIMQLYPMYLTDHMLRSSGVVAI
jgi:hypothetical protein